MGSVNLSSSVNMKTCMKRCTSEMMYLYQNFQFESNYQFKSIQLKVCEHEIYFTIEEFGGKILKFILTERYPFIEPKLMIDERIYNNNILQTPRSERISNILRRNGVDCMCCSSILYHENWSPAFRIENVLFEIAQVRVIKNYVKNYLIMDDICRKINIDTHTIGKYILSFLLDNPFDGHLFCSVK